MAKSKDLQQPCPCGSGKFFQQCCAPYLSGEQVAPDAQALMRSRYTAYTLEDEEYLQKTWHPRSRPVLNLDQQERCKWIGLQIVRHEQQGTNAVVEFIARYKVNGRAERLHEVSRFECEDGQWLYVHGDFPEMGQKNP